MAATLLRAAVPQRQLAEVFDRTNMPAGWQIECTPETRLEARADGLHFNGPGQGLGHLQREVDGNLITVSGRVAQWGAVYLIWKDQDWCGIGQISPTPFGRLFTTVTRNGKADEDDHRGIDFGLARWVQLQLGENFIRFSWSADGKQWTELRTIERTRAFRGPPMRLAVGKYYDGSFAPFTAKAARTARRSNPAPGEPDKIGGRIIELRVTPTPAESSRLSPEEIKKLREPKVDPVTALFRKSKEDPAYESIVGFFPPFKSPREVVGVPLHPLDIGIDRLGRFDVSPWSREPVAWFETDRGGKSIPLGKEGQPFKRRLLNGYLPVDTLWIDRDNVNYELTIFGWSENMRVDQPLFAYARLVMRAESDASLPEAVGLVAPASKRMDFTPANTTHGSVVCLRFKYPEPGTAEPISETEFQARQDEVASTWERKLKPATRFFVPEQRVMEAHRAWLVYSMLNADTINGYIEPHDGSGFYEEMFGNSVSVHSMALDAYGLHDYAAKILDTQRHFQETNGLYTQVCGLTDPGGFLAGLARHYRMTGDKAWLEKVRPNILSQCDWLIEHRAKAPTSGIARGLIKFRPYNDYVAEVYNYLGNCWCAQGMAEVAEALKTIGSPEAARLTAEAKRYRSDILASMETAAFKKDGQMLLPLEPDTRRLLKLERYKGAGYYCLSVSPLLGMGFLAPDDKRTTWFVDALERRGGLIAGLCEFETGIDHAYTYGYLLNELRRGEPRKAILGFYSMLAFGMTRDTYSPVEVTMIETGENHYTLPHLYSCTEQLRLLRSLLVREEGDELRLGEGIPQQWLEGGKQVSITNAPTYFGEVSYSISPQADGSIQLHLEPPHRETPSTIVCVLREPHGYPIASVEGAGETSVRFSKQSIFLKAPTLPLNLLVRFGRR